MFDCIPRLCADRERLRPELDYGVSTLDESSDQCYQICNAIGGREAIDIANYEQGPTVFPILFASVIGRTAHAILLWRLERGEYVSILDTLASSTSLTSTVTSQVRLRTLSVVGIVLVAVWSLSPVGGQASVRLVSIGFKDTQIPDSFPYTVNNGFLGVYSSADMWIEGGKRAGVVFVAALMGSAAVKSSSLDLWGNVKVPRIESYEGRATMDHEGWYDTPGGDVDAYSSLVGIPIANINGPVFKDYNARIQTPYLNFQCSLNNTVTTMGMSGKQMPEPSSNATSSGATIFWNVPKIEMNSTSKQRDRIPPELITALRIRYVPLYADDFLLDCNITSTYVETEIQCPTPLNCTSTKVRRSKLDQFPPAWTLLDVSWRTLDLVIPRMLDNFDGKLFYPQLFDRYLSDPYMTESNWINVSQTTEEKYTIRLGQMFNSYFACVNGFFAITSGINNDTAYAWDNNQTFTMQRGSINGMWEDLFHSTEKNDKFKTKTWISNGTKIEREEVIVAHHRWVITLCFASVLLIVASLTSPLIHHFLATGIDLAINVSSLATRNNPHISIPSSGTFLDASDRARLLGNLKLRFGDAESAGDIGSLAIGSFGVDEDSGVARVQKGRFYE